MIFTIQGKGMPSARFNLIRLGRRADEARPGIEQVYLDLLDVEARVFSSQGRRGGGSWRFLQPETLRRKQRAGLDPRILHATGRLRASLTQVKHPDQFLRITKDKMIFGSKLPYARRHQRGDQHIPARPYLRFMREDIKRWENLIRRHIRGRR